MNPNANQETIIDVDDNGQVTRTSSPPPHNPFATTGDSVEEQTRFWSTLLHLSTLLGFASLGAGLIAPIIIWQWKKTTLPKIDRHGRIVMNAIITYALYVIIAGILCLLLIGFALLSVLWLLSILFPLIAAIKAWQGVAWHYPLSIQFFKINAQLESL